MLFTIQQDGVSVTPPSTSTVYLSSDAFVVFAIVNQVITIVGMYLLIEPAISISDMTIENVVAITELTAQPITTIANMEITQGS